jgi:hypothetical protein
VVTERDDPKALRGPGVELSTGRTRGPVDPLATEVDA